LHVTLFIKPINIKIMRNRIFTLLTIAVLLLALSCNRKPTTFLSETAFIPLPVSVTSDGGTYTVDNSTAVYFHEEADGLKQLATYLSAEMKRIFNFLPRVIEVREMPRRKGIYLVPPTQDEELGHEGYKLIIGKNMITISANGPAGYFYGIQTLLQILPADGRRTGSAEIATGTINDFPDYEYRGAMLDVSRHFFKVEDVKRYIDFLAAYKMNALHLHLSDDQGWRIEIKSWPKLTEIGGSTQVGGGEGGYYTQEDYAEIVRYAGTKFITIVPEIDMPGHTNAALASYPELNCDGKATELYTGTEVGFSTLCTDKEITYRFVDDVVREISALTPGPFFHIGGDESHVTAHDDYVYFINRVQDIVVSHGKRVIGWDEIANAKLVDNAVVQFWADVDNTIMGVEQGAKVIMSPARKAYLDMKYDSTTQLGLSWAGFIEVDTAYIWNPATYIEGVTRENILGIESPLWSETVTNMKEIEYMVFPRLPGYAEIGWTSARSRNWNDYKYRLASHGKRFEAMRINYYRSPLIPWEE
jgi:hexosaminidase